MGKVQLEPKGMIALENPVRGGAASSRTSCCAASRPKANMGARSKVKQREFRGGLRLRGPKFYVET